MSKQTSTEPLPHIHVVSSALRQPDQPAATFRALDAAMKAGRPKFWFSCITRTCKKRSGSTAVISMPI